MATIVVEKDGHVEMDSSLWGGHRSVIPGKIWAFNGDHWHEDSEGEHRGDRLDIIDDTGEIVATFKSGYWTRVYFKESLADSGGN